jgi:ATP-dependent 26S proteasome regulatory subunit
MLELVFPTDATASKIILSPSQHRAAEGVVRGLERGDCAVLKDTGSDGKTTVLAHVHRRLGGARIGVREFLVKLAVHEPAAIEEAFLSMIDDHIERHDLLLVDDLHLVRNIVEGCDYPRKNLFDAVLTAVLESAAASGTKLLLACDDVPYVLSRRAHSWFIEDFLAEDFKAICSAYLTPAVCGRLDFGEIYRYAPSLDAHQLRKAALWLSHEPDLTTAAFLEYLSAHNLASNVEIEEVEPVTWKDLRGVDHLIETLETKIALPFENHEWAARLNLKAKRGVLLAGPPGTGKTTIGRALAHRLKGKFFLIDGTVVAGSHNFYSQVDRVFAAACRNAPSIIFIDDADVIFGDEEKNGFYRYLLTKLDGLESASSKRVCVIMTAMEPADMPIALLRSGRIELWLETRLPDTLARAGILREHLAALPAPFCEIEVQELAEASRGLTGADMKAIVEDGKLLFARDQVTGSPERCAREYFLEAIGTIRQNRRKYRKRSSTQLTDTPAFGFRAQ